MTATLEELSVDECMALLDAHPVARIAFVEPDTGWPVVVPVNIGVVDRQRHRWIALRTRAEGMVDPTRRVGWSVLVRGTLHTVDADAADFDERFDPGPWLDDRNRWLVVEPALITGRRLTGDVIEWGFAFEAYL
jgi:hypothetical protein